MEPLRNGYSKYTDFEICEMIGNGKINGQWMDKECTILAKSATKETATEILNQIDKNRTYSFHFWNMFN